MPSKTPFGTGASTPFGRVTNSTPKDTAALMRHFDAVAEVNVIGWYPAAMQGSHVVDGRSLWAHVVRIDQVAWWSTGGPVRAILDAQGEFLTRFPGTRVECDDRTMVWDGWALLCPAAKQAMTRFHRRYPQWVHRPAWGAVPASHAAYLPALRDP